MKIALVAPDIIPLPPRWGGIERVVYDLSEELVRRGHEVYLYAMRGSSSTAEIIPYEHQNAKNHRAIEKFVLSTLPSGIDVVHDHTHRSSIGRSSLQVPVVTTVHNPVNNGVSYPIYVSKTTLWKYGMGKGTFIHNGINPREYEYGENKDNYLLYLGQVHRKKGVHHAIRVAKKTGHRLIIAGRIMNGIYYDRMISPHIKMDKNIQYVGEVTNHEKRELLKKAKCVLFPTMWDETFGLVMIEAMISGTPVLAFANGAVEEVLQGFPFLICGSQEEMIYKLSSETLPDSAKLRQYVLEHFTHDIMTDKYLQIYKQAIDGKCNPH